MSNTRGIDILFSTHNGARTLPAMMVALHALSAPKRPWRIIAVNNASTDNTGELLAEAARDLPMLVLDCPIPGKMPALKMAVEQVSGDLVIFTDDDVIPCIDWLCAYERAADEAPDAGLFGGSITPRPIDAVSGWFDVSLVHHAELFARAEHAAGPVDAAEHVFGPNFMMRAQHIDVLNSVSGDLGPTFQGKRARQFAMGEDTQIMQLLQDRGVAAVFVPGAAVEHMVRSFQTDLAFMLQRAERHGRGGAIRQMEEASSPVLRRARLVMTQYLRAAWLTLSGARAGGKSQPTSRAFERMWAAHWAKGAWREAMFRANASAAKSRRH